MAPRCRRFALGVAALAAVAAVGACAGPAVSVPAFGPLAVALVAPGDGPPVGATPGRTLSGGLSVTGDCVRLSTDGGHVTLAWPADRTRWHDRQRWITFTRPSGEVVILTPGDRVTVAGAESDRSRGGAAGESWLDSVAWASPPGPACLHDRRWHVTDLVRG